jgi:hypothetical protein
MTKTELKQEAQDALMQSMTAAFYAINDNDDMTEEQREALYAAADEQMRRVEKLFGYEPGSWLRG